MSFERRLHPYSILFAFLKQIRLFVLPGILVFIGASRRDDDWWQPWMMLFIIPNAIFAVIRYLTYRYRYDESELVIRSGLLFRRERHVPYARIQNIDAVQNPLHRALNVVEVKVETGGGDATEAIMSVLPLSALQEMRERVFEQRREPSAATEERAAPPPLLALSVRELLLCGFIENRGGVLIAAAFGVAWELGILDRAFAMIFGQETVGRGALRRIARGAFDFALVSWERIAWIGVAFIALLLVMRAVSMVWAVVRLYGFRLTLVDDDARSEFGLLTRVATTIPRRRIQVLTVREGPLQRYFARVAVKVNTAGGSEAEENNAKAEREFVAPILPTPELAGFVRTLVDVDITNVAWNPPHPQAFRREVKGWLAIALLLSAGLVFYLRWYALPCVVLLLIWAVVAARQTLEHLRWATGEEVVLLRTGWLWRRLIVVRFAKMQVVTLHESPFDRRFTMAAVHVDTAGASLGSAVHIRYLARSDAEALHAQLATAAAGTQFKW
jgi:putative membrane protein